MPFEENFSQAEQHLSKNKVDKARVSFDIAKQEYEQKDRPPLSGQLTERYYQFENDLTEKWLSDIEADAQTQILSPEDLQTRADEFARSFIKIRKLFPDDKQVEIIARIQALRGTRTVNTSANLAPVVQPPDRQPKDIPDIAALHAQIDTYMAAVQDARSRNTNFDPRVPFNGEVPLIKLADLSKQAEEWIPLKGDDTTKLERRNLIIKEINKVEALVDELQSEINDIDDEEYASWQIPVDVADVNEISRLSSVPDTNLATLSDTDLNTDLVSLQNILNKVIAAKSALPKRFSQAIVDKINSTYPDIIVDFLYLAQEAALDAFVDLVATETTRRQKHLETYNQNQAILTAEQARLAAEAQKQAAEAARQQEIIDWGTAIQPLETAINSVLNPVKPLDDQTNDEWIELLKALRAAEKAASQLLVKRSDLPETHPLIDQINLKISNAVDKLPIITEVNPNDAWKTYAWKFNFVTRGEDPTTHHSVEKIKIGTFSMILNIITKEMWEGPNDPSKKSEIDFEKFPIRKDPANKVDLLQVIYNHPDADEGKEFRAQLKVLTHTLEGGISWGQITAVPDHTKIKDHLSHYMYDGAAYHEIIHLPALGSEKVVPGYQEPGAGELIFEGMSWYAKWNSKFIYANEQDIADLSKDRDDKLRTDPRLMRIPTESEIKKTFAALKGNESVGVELNLGSENPITTKIALRIYYGESKQNYDQFKELFKEEIVRRQINALEKKRQTVFGIHPLREIGDELRNLGQVSQRALNIKRAELAVALGCYRLGYGDYTPDLTSLSTTVRPATTESGILREFGTGTVKQLTPDQKQAALEEGKLPELFAFSGYECNGNQILDDNISAKSAVTAGRLTQTSDYRTNYAEVGREGLNLESVKIFKQLFPSPWMYMGVDGISLKKMLGDRQRRKTANYSNLGSSESGPKIKLLEAYDYAVKIYGALAYGTQRAEPNVDFLKLADIERPGGMFSREEILKPHDKEIQILGEFVSKIIGYYLDRMVVETKEVESKGSIYSPTFWRPIPGTKFSSPVPELMTNLPKESLARLTAETNKVGFIKAWTKVYLTSIILESLMRSHAKEIDLADKVTLKYILAGTPPNPYIVGGASKKPREVVNTPDYSKMFGYTDEEVEDIIQAANLDMKNEFNVFLQQLGGL